MDFQIKIQSILMEVYKSLINITQITKDSYDLELPLFLNTGDAVDIQICIKNGEVILKNKLHRLIEEAVSDKCTIQHIRKEYFFNSKKFTILKDEMINNGIEVNLLLEKKIPEKIFYDTLEKEIFLYLFQITRYYNYVYDYIVERLNGEDQEEIFKNEIKKFIENFNQKRSKHFCILENENFDIISTYNIYYKYNVKVITGVNSRVHLLEAIMDLKKIKEKEKELKSYILIDKRKKNDITDTYIEKMIKNEKDIHIHKVENFKNLKKFEKILDKEYLNNDIN